MESEATNSTVGGKGEHLWLHQMGYHTHYSKAKQNKRSYGQEDCKLGIALLNFLMPSLVF